MKLGEHVVQGDLLIVRVAACPTKGIQKELNGVIMEGETTGHKHRMTSGQVLLIENSSECEQYIPKKHLREAHAFVQLEEPAELVHEDHNTIHLGVGTYLVIRQRESTHLVND